MKMTFLPDNYICEFEGSPTILEVALANGVPLNHSCGGMGSCTTCLLKIKTGLEKFSPRNELEAEHAIAREFQDFERLACQNSAFDGLVVEIPQDDN